MNCHKVRIVDNGDGDCKIFVDEKQIDPKSYSVERVVEGMALVTFTVFSNHVDLECRTHGAAQE